MNIIQRICTIRIKTPIEETTSLGQNHRASSGIGLGSSRGPHPRRIQLPPRQPPPPPPGEEGREGSRPLHEQRRVEGVVQLVPQRVVRA